MQMQAFNRPMCRTSLTNVARQSRSLLLAAFALLLAMPAAHAGRACEVKKTSLKTVQRSMGLAEKTLASLNASGEKVVALARAGQDLSKYGLQYSHFGFAYRQPDGQGGMTWRVLHKLNECGTADSAIYLQGLGEFFLEDIWRYEAQWIAFTPEVQERLLVLFQDADLAVSMNHKAYSVVSYAWGRKYQQSNQWAIETLAAAMEPVTIAGPAGGVDARRTKAQAWLQFKGYEPTALKIGPVTRLGGRATAANVAFDDHPNEKRFADRIETVTVDSVFEWLQRSKLVGPGLPTVVEF
jgi:hypothetical protein